MCLITLKKCCLRCLGYYCCKRLTSLWDFEFCAITKLFDCPNNSWINTIMLLTKMSGQLWEIILILVYIRWKNNIFIEIDWIYAIKLHILTLSQIATRFVTNRDTRHKLRHFQSQIATPSQIATITNCYVTRCTQGGANPWADSCEGWIRCHWKLSARGNHPGTWLCVHILMLVCFLLKGLGGGGSGVGSWAGIGLIIYNGMDCELFFHLYFASIVPICMYRVVIGYE